MNNPVSSGAAAAAPYYEYSTFLRQRYGAVLYRIPVDLGLGCPNRDAAGGGGCSFCAADGGRAQQTRHANSLIEQVAAGLEFARRRYGASQFMAYIQAFTGTFAPASQQRQLYETVLSQFDFAAVHIGTRPDCLTPETLIVLEQLQQQLDVWVELGVQTTHDATLRALNRGHDWECSRQAIGRLHASGIKVAAHVILGLPGETAEHFHATANALAATPIDAVKIHNLHVLHGSQLARQYEAVPFPVWPEYAYAEILIEFLRRLPARLPIMRLCTDSPEAATLAPHWRMSKGEFLQYLSEQMLLRQVRQGDQVPGQAAPEPAPALFTATPIATADGSVTFWNPLFKEHYHAPAGALSEALAKYVRPAQLEQRLCERPVRLLDICFGLGYNSLCACAAAARLQRQPLEIVALEMDRGALQQAAQHLVMPADASLDWRHILQELHRAGVYRDRYFSIVMLWGDARHSIARAADTGAFELVFHDPFSTQRNSELWTVEFFTAVRRCMTANALLLTYCTALPVWAGLQAAGFCVGKTTAAAASSHRPSTVAAPDARLVKEPLSPQELALINTTYRGIPYRDPDGVWRNKKILHQRQMQVEACKAAAAAAAQPD